MYTKELLKQYSRLVECTSENFKNVMTLNPHFYFTHDFQLGLIHLLFRMNLLNKSHIKGFKTVEAGLNIDKKHKI